MNFFSVPCEFDSGRIAWQYCAGVCRVLFGRQRSAMTSTLVSLNDGGVMEALALMQQIRAASASSKWSAICCKSKAGLDDLSIKGWREPCHSLHLKEGIRRLL